jgi:hypothetical protein
MKVDSLAAANEKASAWSTNNNLDASFPCLEVPPVDAPMMWDLMRYFPIKAMSETSIGIFHPTLDPYKSTSMVLPPERPTETTVDQNSVTISSSITTPSSNKRRNKDDPLPLVQEGPTIPFSDLFDLSEYDQYFNNQSLHYGNMSGDWWNIGNL